MPAPHQGRSPRTRTRKKKKTAIAIFLREKRIGALQVSLRSFRTILGRLGTRRTDGENDATSSRAHPVLARGVILDELNGRFRGKRVRHRLRRYRTTRERCGSALQSRASGQSGGEYRSGEKRVREGAASGRSGSSGLFEYGYFFAQHASFRRESVV